MLVAPMRGTVWEDGVCEAALSSLQPVCLIQNSSTLLSLKIHIYTEVVKTIQSVTLKAQIDFINVKSNNFTLI